MKEDKEKPPKIKKTQKKKNMKEQWDFEAAPHGYVLPEVLRLFYSFKARQMLNNTSCALQNQIVHHSIIEPEPGVRIQEGGDPGGPSLLCRRRRSLNPAASSRLFRRFSAPSSLPARRCRRRRYPRRRSRLAPTGWWHFRPRRART